MFYDTVNETFHVRSPGDVIKRMLLGLILALVIGTAHAQSSAVAWIYTASDGSIVRVNTANGAIIDAYRLPLSPAFNVYGPAAIVSSGGRFVAYTAIDNLTGTNNRQLVVYDTQVGAIRFTYDLTGVSDGALDFERTGRSASFDEAAQTFAFGLVRGGAWELVVANLASESIAGDAPLTNDQAAIENGLPVVEVVRGTAVRFFILPLGAGYVREYTAYLWAPGQTVTNVGASSAFADVLPSSSEIAVPIHNPDLPSAGDPNGPSLAYNGVDLVRNGRVSMLYDGQLDIRQVWWIAGGSQVLLEGFNPASGADVYKVYDRGGAVIGEISGALEDVHATPDGFAGLYPSGGGAGLAVVTTADGTLTTASVWGTGDPTARLVFVQQ
ncbi:MAG: hypothetical protein DWB44_16970 [Chloroflexi bacterium]|nr:hypothetical protein [Chloroflexota bacterium]OQY81650.1 MAG: hypothetical protein B6D42_10840 [Anaerolineae bacterium UTCFX5]